MGKATPQPGSTSEPFLNLFIDAAKQKAASIKWEKRRPNQVRRPNLRSRFVSFRFPNGTDGRTRYGLNFREQHPIKYVEQHPIKYVAPLIRSRIRIRTS